MFVNVPLLYSVYELDSKMTVLEADFKFLTEDTLEYVSPKILNNIFVSRDFKYKRDGVVRLCRITISYYENPNPNQTYATTAIKQDSLQFYT